MPSDPSRSPRSLARSGAPGPSRSAGADAKTADLRIGTSGWHYESWRSLFYPQELRPKDFLSFYRTRFATAELNNPFYRMPGEGAVRAWREGTPEDFLFAWKVSRFVTHMKRLRDVEESMRFVLSRADLLGPKLGPLLIQLPPTLRVDRDRLGAFLALLPQDRRFAFEFRHPSWYEPAIFDLLRDHDAALCLSDHAAAPAPWRLTASFVYVRGHGPGGRYAGNYPDETLAAWSSDIRRWRREGRDIHVYFDNDIKSAAPADAERLIALAGSG